MFSPKGHMNKTKNLHIKIGSKKSKPYSLQHTQNGKANKKHRSYP